VLKNKVLLNFSERVLRIDEEKMSSFGNLLEGLVES